MAVSTFIVRWTNGPPLRSIAVCEAPIVSTASTELFTEVATLGFHPLGWLYAELIEGTYIAGFLSPDGRTSLVLMGQRLPFNVSAIDCVSRLDDDRWVTTTTMHHTASMPQKGLYKFAEGPTSIAMLHHKHLENIASLDGVALPAPSSAEALGEAIEDYIERQRKRS